MKQDNPAKVFLRRYITICGRVDALQRAIDEAMARGRMFRPEEAKAREKHICRLTGEER